MSQNSQKPVEQITCENITDEIAASYAKQGFTLTFAEDVMQYDLTRPVPPIISSKPISFVSWAADRGHDFFMVYQASFRERPGFLDWGEDEAQWIQWISEDPTFRADLSYIAMVQGQAVGFIANADDESSKQTGYIIQVGVHPDWRSQKIAASLVTRVMLAWQKEGKEKVLLHVNVNNPRAIHLYQQLGFTNIGKRGKFLKRIA